MTLISCSECANDVSDRAAACPRCGCPIPVSFQPFASTKPTPAILVRVEKTRSTYVILGVVGGVLGVHNFYAGRYARGAGQFALTVLLGWIVVGVAASWIWAMIDLLTIETDASGKPLS